ncbi:FUSC family protein [Pseudonocardia nigra]|uniref:FUSC family protein n=1 Tax=Pseudonocardia nigra TaxID=1921578 RepID=UPI001C5FC9B2|nr:FUSC family protein [Pseudonocardia nigra]
MADLLDAAPDAVDDEMEDVRRRRTRLNETALLVADTLEQDQAGNDPDELALRVLDAELAAERVALTTQRLVGGGEPVDPDARRALLAAMRGIGAASATGAPPGYVTTLLAGAKRSVDPLAAESAGDRAGGHGERVHRVAFAMIRLADALEVAREPDAAPQRPSARDEAADEADSGGTEPGDTGGDGAAEEPEGLRLTTRQAVQVGVATSLAIVVGELVSPARWYWAVIAAFVVFAGTSSRGDVLSRGYQRVIGTIGGVIAGMALAVLVGDRPLLVLAALFGCVFLALYLMRVSQALMAFWITAVLALLYGLIGQFDVATLVVRIEETAVGAAMGMLAGYLVLPKRTREAFDEALDEFVDAADAVLAAAVDRIVGREPDTPPVELARDAGDALATLRQRAKPLDTVLLRGRGRSSYERALRVLTGVDHYARGLARLSDSVVESGWADTLDPAADRVRADLDVLRRLLLRREGAAAGLRSAEELVDAAEEHAARLGDARRRVELLAAVWLLRRIDQAVVGFATDLTSPEPTVAPDTVPWR